MGLQLFRSLFIFLNPVVKDFFSFVLAVNHEYAFLLDGLVFFLSIENEAHLRTVISQKCTYLLCTLYMYTVQMYLILLKLSLDDNIRRSLLLLPGAWM